MREIMLSILLIQFIIFDAAHSFCPYINQSVYNGHIDQPHNAASGNEAKVTCEDSYVISNKRNNNMTSIKCQSDGTWAEQIPNCKPKRTKNLVYYFEPRKNYSMNGTIWKEIRVSFAVAAAECTIKCWQDIRCLLFNLVFANNGKDIICQMLDIPFGKILINPSSSFYDFYNPAFCATYLTDEFTLPNNTHWNFINGNIHLAKNGSTTSLECDDGFTALIPTTSHHITCSSGLWIGDQNITMACTADPDVCVLENPCKNNGDCTDGIGLDYSCTCANGYAGKNCTEPVGQVLIIGGINDAGKTIELYDTEQPANNKVLDTQLNETRYGHVSGVFDNGIVVIAGGLKNGVYTSDTDFYDPIKDIIFAGPPMIETRGYAGSAMVNNEMVVCGGFDGIALPLATCEKLSYNEATGQFSKWELFPSMNAPSYSFAMAQYNNDIFLMGGHVINGTTDTSSYYNHTTNVWSSLSPMGIVRSQLAAAPLGGFVYACGGRSNGGMIMNICQKYNPVSATWSNATSMNTAAIGLALISMHGKLYSFTGNTNRVVECYDPTSDTWTTTQPTLKSRPYSQVVQLKSYLHYPF